MCYKILLLLQGCITEQEGEQEIRCLPISTLASLAFQKLCHRPDYSSFFLVHSSPICHLSHLFQILWNRNRLPGTGSDAYTHTDIILIHCIHYYAHHCV